MVIGNFGQYNHLIYRTLRDLGIPSKLLLNTVSFDKIREEKPSGIVLGGGPTLERVGVCPEIIRKIEVPILGICLGHQLMAKEFGGDVGSGKRGGFAEVEVYIDKPVDIFEGFPPKIKTWSSHNDEIKTLPDCFEILAHSDICEYEAIRHKKRPLFGVQFHPEVIHTQLGSELYKNFAKICDRYSNSNPTKPSNKF